jgi:hypothetical protein
MDAVEYLASCHCGALRARYRTMLPPSAWSIRACQCSFCRRHGAMTTSDPAGLIAYECSQAQLLQRYRFGSRTAEYLICRACGVYLGAQVVSEDKRFGILNALTLTPVPAHLPRPASMDYEGELPDARRQRRQDRWTPIAHDSV